MNNDRPALGILLMLGFCVTVPLADALAKLLGESLSVGVLVAIRMVLQVVLLAPFLVFGATTLKMSARDFRYTVARAVLHLIGIGLMVWSLKFLPLADAVAIAFVMPFIMLLLGHFVLGEEVGHRRFTACCVGFIGTLMVMQPSFAQVGWPALLPVGVAIDFALFMLVTRQVAKTVEPIALQLASGLVACAIILPLLAVLGPLTVPGFAITWPEGTPWGLALIMGVLGTVAHLLMTWALRFAPSATLAPMQYLEIPAAALVGWLIFRDFPNGLALAGIAVTILAGLYIIAREQRLDRQVPQSPEAEPRSEG